jgi:diguanylate cyclase (GGDEF)-like protein/PAS domain S-box-containing protein
VGAEHKSRHGLPVVLAAVQCGSMLVFDSDLRYVRVAGGALEAHGYRPEDMEGRLCADVEPPDRWVVYEPMYRAALNGEEAATEHDSLDGSRRFAVDVRPLHDGNGDVIGGVANGRDVTELRRLEAELRLNERMFRAAFEISPVGIVRATPDGEFIEFNDAFADMLGYSRDELAGKTFRDVTPPDDIAAIEDMFVSVAPGGEQRQYRGEKRYLREDGSVGWAHVSAVLIEANEYPVQVHMHVIDITERKLSEEKFRRLVEMAPDAMVIVDAHGEIVLVNGQTEMTFGYTRQELIGQRVELLVPDRFRNRHADHRGAYSADPHTRAMGVWRELHGLRKDGSEFPIEVALSPVQTEQGTLVSSTIRDITERQRAQREASHFAAVVESSHDAINGQDLDGYVTSWNRGAERLYGYTEAEMLGKSISVLVPPWHDDELPEILRRVRLGERINAYETVRGRKDGTQVDVSLTVSPICGPDGKVVGASTIGRDISTRLRHQEQLRVLSEHDPLTGMRNRRCFERDVTEQVRRAHRYGEPAALLMIDIDGFKQINDAHGHKAGDRALKQFAAMLKQRLRDTDVIARIGGDEFAALLPYAGEPEATAVVDDLRRVIAESWVDLGDGPSISLCASIGIALITHDTANDETVLSAADQAMYEDKKSGHAVAAAS